MSILDRQSVGQGQPGSRTLSCSLEQVVIEAQERERERIAQEVHDSIAQTLASALRYLQALEGLSQEDWGQARPLLIRTGTLMRQAIREVRSFLHTLQPATLSYLGLAAALRQEMCQLEADTGWQVEFVCHCGRLSKDAELALYRIAREAVTNARKHSGTHRLRVSLVQKGNSVELEVQDWGKGFDIGDRPPSETSGWGLTNMQRRAEVLGGTFYLHSQEGAGTVIRVEVPTAEDAYDAHD